MADRKPFLGGSRADEELLELLRQARGKEITEKEFLEQRISFAYGNAMNLENVTKESVRRAAQNPRLRS